MNGKELKQLRKYLGLKQEYVALRADMFQSNLSRIENGTHQITDKVLKRILRVLNESTTTTIYS